MCICHAEKPDQKTISVMEHQLCVKAKPSIFSMFLNEEYTAAKLELLSAMIQYIQNMWTCNSVCEQQNTVHVYPSETQTHQSGWRTLCDRDHTSVRCSPALWVSSVLVTLSPVYRALRGSNRASKLIIIIMDPVPPAQLIRRVKLNSSFMLTLLAVMHSSCSWSCDQSHARNMGRKSVTFIFIRNRLIMGNILEICNYALWCCLLAASKKVHLHTPNILYTHTHTTHMLHKVKYKKSKKL